MGKKVEPFRHLIGSNPTYLLLRPMRFGKGKSRISPQAPWPFPLPYAIG